MDKFAENLAAGIRRFAMAGVGAVSLTVDKSKEIISHLAERGEITASEGHVACDELQKKLADQVSAFTQKLKDDYENASFARLLEACEKLTPEQKEQLLQKLTAAPDEAPSADACESDCCAADAPAECPGCVDESAPAACEPADPDESACCAETAEASEPAPADRSEA